MPSLSKHGYLSTHHKSAANFGAFCSARQPLALQSACLTRWARVDERVAERYGGVLAHKIVTISQIHPTLACAAHQEAQCVALIRFASERPRPACVPPTDVPDTSPSPCHLPPQPHPTRPVTIKPSTRRTSGSRMTRNHTSGGLAQASFIPMRGASALSLSVMGEMRGASALSLFQ